MSTIPSKKKILFILESKFAHGKGTQRFLVELGNYLQLNGYNVVLLENAGASMPDKPAPMSIKPNFEIKSAKFKKLGGIYLVPKKCIKNEKPDLIYCTNIQSLPFVPLLGIPVIFGTLLLNIGSLPYLSRKEKFLFSLKKFVLKSFFANFIWNKKKIFFHAVNTEQLDWLNKLFKGKFQVFFIELPVRCSDIPVKENYQFNTKNPKFTILYFGSFSPYRGFIEFLKIVDEINSSSYSEKIEFVVAGDGPFFNMAQSYKNKYSNFHLIRRPNDFQKFQIMIKSDLFVYPSVIENYSIILAEAQLCGLPAVVSDTVATKNIVLDGITGKVVKKQEPAEFIYSIIDFFSQWESDYDSYINMRKDIIIKSQRLCSEKILPKYLGIINAVLNESAHNKL